MQKRPASHIAALVVCGLFALDCRLSRVAAHSSRLDSFRRRARDHPSRCHPALRPPAAKEEGRERSEDFFFILHGRNGKGVAISNDLAVKHDLVATLQNRLPGLDNKAIIEASLSTEVRRFLVWQKMG